MSSAKLDTTATDAALEDRYLLAKQLTSFGRPEDASQVVELYLQGAADGHVPSMHGLAACYHNGYGVEQDSQKALHWFSEAANRDCRDSWYCLGLVHRDLGEHEKAVECWEHAAEMGQSDALFSLALAYGRGEGVPEDEDKMRSLTEEAAEMGNVEAQYWTGCYYRYGEGRFPVDLEKAFEWYTRAADANHAKAIYCVALHLLLGKGVEQDIEKAWGLFEKAAGMDVVDAMMALATMIDTGGGLVDDPAEALKWYQKAAEKGNVEAQVTAGKRMLEIPDERRFARNYLEMAANQGNEEAKELLENLPADLKPAVPDPNDVLSKAIAGDAQSQYQLGFGHFMGIGMARSMPLSYFWFSVLSRTMPPQAAQMLQMLKGQLSDEQRASIDEEVAKWQIGMAPPEL